MESVMSVPGGYGRARPSPISIADAEAVRPLHVAVIAAHPIVRSSLARLLAGRDDLDVVAEAVGLGDLGLSPEALSPEAILFAAAGSSDETLAIARAASELAVPVVVVGDDSDVDFAALQASGISGYLLPDATDVQIAAALHAVAAGLVVSGAPRPDPLDVEVDAVPSRGSDDPLTDREMQVLQLVANGLPNKGIARRLNISDHTVKFHVGSILSKLGVGSRTEAVTQAAHRGLLTL
jgi:DNA-binding NarL/FixJ family response regulator